MNRGPDESTPPGTCPLCQSAVPEPAKPWSAREVVAVLGQHLGTDCPTTAFTTPFLSN